MTELLVAAAPGEWRAAWIEDGTARELYVERGDTKPPGSRHLGRIVRVVRGLDAAFVDIGDERPGFLPLRDVPDGMQAEEGAALVVEIRREAWQDKAPRLTAKVAVAAVLSPDLVPPVQLFPVPGLTPALVLRLPAPPERIIADDAAILAELAAAFPGLRPAHRAAVVWPADIDALFEAALSPSLTLPGGGVMHLDETRAATIIDVDTGMPERGSSARAALAANRAAALLVAHELRLRNIGGAVVIDFVGLDRRDHRDQIRQTLEAALAGDPAKPEVLGWTRLGHLELSRPRRGRSLADAMLLPGTRAKQPIALAHEALRLLLREARIKPAANWRLTVAKDVEVALRGSTRTALQGLQSRLGRSIAIETAVGFEGFDFTAI